MTTACHEKISCFTGLYLEESTGKDWIPPKRPVMCIFDIFFSVLFARMSCWISSRVVRDDSRSFLPKLAFSACTQTNLPPQIVGVLSAVQQWEHCHAMIAKGWVIRSNFQPSPVQKSRKLGFYNNDFKAQAIYHHDDMPTYIKHTFWRKLSVVMDVNMVPRQSLICMYVFNQWQQE